jgi:hypothetical protein
MCGVLDKTLLQLHLGITGSLQIVLIGIQMLGMSMNEQNHGSKELLMLSVLALRMTLELVKVMVLPCGRDDLGNYIVLLSWIDVVANRLAAPPNKTWDRTDRR